MTGWQQLDDNPATREIAAADGHLYQLHQGGAIFKYTGPPMTGWQQLDGNPASVTLAAGGAEIYQMHNNGFIWRYAP